MSLKQFQEKMSLIDHKALEVFTEVDLSLEDIINLNREDLAELFPGHINFKRRKLILQSINEFKEKNDVGDTFNEVAENISFNLKEQQVDLESQQPDEHFESDNSTASTLLYLSDDREYNCTQQKVMSPIANRKENYREKHKPLKKSINFDEKEMTAKGDSKSDSSPSTSSLSKSLPKEVHSSNVSQLKCPSYTLYKDDELISATKNGLFSTSHRHRLIRAQVSCMKATAIQPPFSRKPKRYEVEEVAKSLVHLYPSLKDPVTLHEPLFIQLLNRLKNTKDVKKQQGPCKQRGDRKRKLIGDATDLSTSDDNEETLSTSEEEKMEMSIFQQNDNAPDAEGETSLTGKLPDGIAERHYNALWKEMGKKKPCVKTIKIHLDAEFERRRNWIVTLPIESRICTIIKKYPCFRDDLEVTGEVERILKVEKNIMKAARKSFFKNIDSLIYFGISARHMNPPKPTLVDKVCYLLRNINILFPSKKKSAAGEFFIELKDDDNLASLNKQRKLLFLVMYQNEILVMSGKKILIRFDNEEIVEALITLLGFFYLADIDYPKGCEISFTVLQFILFNDRKTPSDILDNVNRLWSEYCQFAFPEEKKVEF